MAEFVFMDEPPAASERYIDPVVKYYMQFVDVEELRANLKLTVTERLEKFERRTAEFRKLQANGGGSS